MVIKYKKARTKLAGASVSLQKSNVYSVVRKKSHNVF
jgi:hypothetical protein